MRARWIVVLLGFCFVSCALALEHISPAAGSLLARMIRCEPVHIVAHSILYGSLAIALAKWAFPPAVIEGKSRWRRALLAMLGFCLVAGSQELVQAVSRGRMPGSEEAFDLVVDGAGATLGLIAWSLFDKRRVYPLARALGVILHPGFIGPLGVFALTWSTLRDTRAALGWTLVLVLAVVPLVALWLVGLKLGWYTDRDLSVRTQRPRFLLVALGAATALLIVVHLAKAPAIVRDMTIANLIATALFTLTTIVGTKVSGHVAVPVGVVVLFAAISSRGPWPFLLVALSVSWARIREGRHTPSEVVAGWCIAGASCLLTRLVA